MAVRSSGQSVRLPPAKPVGNAVWPMNCKPVNFNSQVCYPSQLKIWRPLTFTRNGLTKIPGTTAVTLESAGHLLNDFVFGLGDEVVGGAAQRDTVAVVEDDVLRGDGRGEEENGGEDELHFGVLSRSDLISQMIWIGYPVDERLENKL